MDEKVKIENSAGCRFCGTRLSHTFVDLGMSPLSNSYLKPGQLNKMEPFYPLHAYVCSSCFLVQLEQIETPERIFSDYAYFSSYSDTWLKHAKDYAEAVTRRFKLDASSLAVEIASNDGYLLGYLLERGIGVLGIEPAANVAQAAVKKGIPTMVEFFGTKLASSLASSGKKADLLIANNVLAHVPDLNDFVKGMKVALKNRGVLTVEFPHLMRLVEERQFDTIYHEHFSYFSLTTAEKVLSEHGLTVFDVEEIPTHGGSLRIFAKHCEDGSKPVSERVLELREREKSAGVTGLGYYLSFAEKVKETKNGILDFVIKAKREGKSIAGYGAPAKGNTLLNYCGIRMDFLDYTVDRNPVKQGQYLPGTHIPIYHPDRIRQTRPDILIILPWNLKEEVMEQMSCIRSWGGRFAVLIPEARVF